VKSLSKIESKFFIHQIAGARSIEYSNSLIKELFVKYFNNLDIKNFYLHNSYRLRCDEFTKNHSGMHILFAGCSVTYGEGVFLEDCWAYKIYKEISKNNKTSGYFNVAAPGATNLEAIAQTFKYIEKFGKPDVIFMNLPDLSRDVFEFYEPQIKPTSSQDIEDVSKQVSVNRVSSEVIEFYGALSLFCKLLNIKLYTFSWHNKSIKLNKKTLNHFNYLENFYTFKEKDLQNHCYKYLENNKKSNLKPIFITALDGVHQGVAVHDFYFNFIYDIYQKDLKS
jgi:hypothetical protein